MTEMDIFEVLKNLPQRYPILMIDRVKHCDIGKRIVALKNVSANEPYFQGHFPGYPVMPGVLVLEALIQLSTLLSESSGQGAPGTVQTIDGVRFKRQVIPGDQLMLETQMHGAGKFTVRASVDGELATEAEVVLVADAPLP